MELAKKTIRNKIPDVSAMVYGKVPPQAIDIEKAVLGGLLVDKNGLVAAMPKLFPEIFYSNQNNLIFKAMQNLYDAMMPIDTLTVVEQLRKNEDLDAAGGAYYITTLTRDIISSAHIETHCFILSEMYLKREMIRISGEAITDAYEDSTDAFDLIGTADESIQKIQERVLTGMSRDIMYFGLKVLEQHSNVKETGVLGLSTGIEVLDKAICGLVAPDLIILAARPGQGKTACALSVTYNTSVKKNIPCAWFSLEMDGVQLVRRLASIDTKISHERIRTGKTTSNEDLMLQESVERIANSKIFIEDKTSMNARDIRTKASLLKKKHNIQYIVVDYIQLMQGTDTKGKNREQVVSEISRGLKIIAKELEIPVIALSQLSREVEKRPDKMPQLSDLRESGAIEQDADTVIFLMRPEYYKLDAPVTIGGTDYNVQGLCVGAIEKNRHGKPKSIPLNFTGECMYFSDVTNFTPNYDYKSYSEPSKDDDTPF